MIWLGQALDRPRIPQPQQPAQQVTNSWRAKRRSSPLLIPPPPENEEFLSPKTPTPAPTTTFVPLVAPQTPIRTVTISQAAPTVTTTYQPITPIQTQFLTITAVQTATLTTDLPSPATPSSFSSFPSFRPIVSASAAAVSIDATPSAAPSVGTTVQTGLISGDGIVALAVIASLAAAAIVVTSAIFFCRARTKTSSSMHNEENVPS